MKKGPRLGTRVRNKNKEKSQTPETDKESSPVVEEPKPETKVEEPAKIEDTETKPDEKNEDDTVHSAGMIQRKFLFSMNNL